MLQSIFISKDVAELNLLPSFCQRNNLQLTAASLIDFRPVSFSFDGSYEVIFFSSIRAFDFFVAKVPHLAGKELACIGSTTAQRIQERGYSLSFIGNSAGEPEKVAQEFKEWLGKRTVLIPCSGQSNRSIAKVIPSEQLAEVIVYETIQKTKAVAKNDCYIFTSPSNFKSFNSSENSTTDSTIIAWGTTTNKAIESTGLEANFCLKTSTEEELIAILQKLL